MSNHTEVKLHYGMFQCTEEYIYEKKKFCMPMIQT